MQKPVTEAISDLIVDTEKNHSEKDKKELELFVSALQEFNKLVEQGVAHKRGYNLMKIEDMQRQPLFSKNNIRQLQKL